jgi:hypothetical protein
MWDPQRLTTLWASTACYRDSFTFFTLKIYDLAAKEMNAYAMLCPDSTVQYLPRSRYWKWEDVTAHQTGALAAAKIGMRLCQKHTFKIRLSR